MEEPLREKHLFRPVQPLGKPSVIAPMIMGKIPVSLQFIIPDLHITNKEKINFQNLIKKCWSEAWDSEIRTFKNKKIEWTLFTIAFHIDYLEDEGQRQQVINNKTHIFIERFLGVISYCAGIKLRAVNKVTTIIIGPNFKATINPVSKSESPKIKFSIPTELVSGTVLSDEIYAALFWLRRGLAESDPINVFNPLMICLQILARDWFKKKNPQSQIPSITSLFKDYTITELGADPSVVDEVWKKKRNAIVAHGNKLIIDADDFMRLTELKFEAAIWAYRGINRALGLDQEKAPRPSQNFFVTDTFMNLD